MATLTSGFNWDPDTFNGASFVGGISATIVFTFLMWGVWRVAIGPQIERARRERRQRAEFQTEVLRAQIRTEVLAALEHGSDDEVDPDEFEEDDAADPAWPGSGRPD